MSLFISQHPFLFYYLLGVVIVALRLSWKWLFDPEWFESPELLAVFDTASEVGVTGYLIIAVMFTVAFPMLWPYSVYRMIYKILGGQ